MNAITQVLYYYFLFFITFVFGFPLFLIQKKKQLWISQSILFGTAVLILISFWISSVSVNGMQNKPLIVCCAFFAFFVTICIIRRKKLKEMLSEIKREDIICLFVCFAAGLIPLSLSVIFKAQYPFIDGYTYICNADFFMEHGLYSIPSEMDLMYQPWLSQTYLYQTEGFRVGAQLLLAFFSSLFKERFSIEVFLPLISFGISLCGFASLSVLQKENSRTLKIFCVCFICFNAPIMISNAIYGYLPQTIAGSLFIAAFGSLMNDDTLKERLGRNILSLSVFVSTLAITYSEMLPFYVLVFLFVVLRDLLSKTADKKRLVLNKCFSSVGAMLLVANYVPKIFSALLTQMKVVVGWNQDKDLFTCLGQMLSSIPIDFSFRSEASNAKVYLYQLITFSLFVLVILGFTKIEKTKRRVFLLYSVPYFAMFLYVGLISKNPFGEGNGNSWSVFKLVQYYFVFLSPFLAMCLFESLRRSKALIYGFLILFLSFGGVCGFLKVKEASKTMKSFVMKEENPISEYYKLYEKYSEDSSRIILLDGPLKHKQLITYFLRDHEIVSDWTDDCYFSTVPKASDEEFINGVHLSYGNEKETNVAGYHEINQLFLFSADFFDQETDESNVWRWCKGDAELAIQNYAGERVLRFELLAHSEKEETVPIQTSDKRIFKVILLNPGEKKEVSVNLPVGKSELFFQYGGSAVQAGAEDLRQITFAIFNYRFEGTQK